MVMETQKYLDICTMDGNPFVTLLVRVRDNKEPQAATPPKPYHGQEKRASPDQMTEPQQRKLFRLLAEQKIEDEEAHAELKRRFRVNDLGDVSKVEASRMIETLIQEAKGGK
jgi:hypothetical protein